MDISLYFHIPFCKKKCPYCHFYSICGSEDRYDELLKCFIQEWQQKKPLLTNHKIVSLYFGGGTPSLFGPKRIEALLNTIVSSCDLSSSSEITLETNPDNASKEAIREFKAVGINRMSLGVQSFDDFFLKELQRTYTAKTAKESMEIISSYIPNLSIDLMYDLPHQTLASWQQTLSELDSLPFCHLSLYNLTIEPKTAFFQKKAQLLPLLPSQETSLQLLQTAVSHLEKIGFTRYEISAFAKDDKVSLHNIGYWNGRPFLGFGPSAFSFYNGKRFSNVSNFVAYRDLITRNESAVDFEEELPYPQNLSELLAIHLRLIQGVDLKIFQKTWGNIPEELSEKIKALIEQGLLEKKENLCLTAKGLLYYDLVAENLL